MVEVGGLLEAVAVHERPGVDGRAAGGANREEHPAVLGGPDPPDRVTAAQARAGLDAVLDPLEPGIGVAVAQPVLDDDADAGYRRDAVALRQVGVAVTRRLDPARRAGLLAGLGAEDEPLRLHAPLCQGGAHG